jgi:hypothetical protein
MSLSVIIPFSFHLSRALILATTLLVWNRESFSVGAFLTADIVFVADWR